jgi:hypothetical protein
MPVKWDWMNGSVLAAVALAGLLGLPPNAADFDALKPGAIPPGWSFVSMPDAPAHWEIRRDPTAPSRGNVLVQATGAKESESPLALFDNSFCRDGDLTVKLRIDGNSGAHSAGVVWRYQNPSNYYLLRLSADQRTVGLFRVHNGIETSIPVVGGRKTSVVPHDVQANRWYIAKVIFRGPRIRVLVGNRKLFDAEDRPEGALLSPGKAGVWTRGLTHAAFDDFRIDKKG